MALMTGEEYVESIRSLKLNVYMFGEKIENPVDDPILRPSLNSVKVTYDLAQLPEYEDLMTVTLEDGRKINRFANIHRSTDYAVRRQLPASSVVLVWMHLMRNGPQPMRSIKSTEPSIMRTLKNI